MSQITTGPVRLDIDPAGRTVQAREKLLLDGGWRFGFGHPLDTVRDHHHGEQYFSYWAKAGYGDGAATAGFDDRGWRLLDLPHDWAVELPFSGEASHSHGYHTIGPKWPELSVGWYRRHLAIPAGDKGRRIALRFDGVFRNWQVWINGFYLGHQFSGYRSVEYDLSEYLNYGGDNVIAVRVDARMEEGWFYEGAGIYRHVWLTKTEAVHHVWDGVAVTTAARGADALVQARCEVLNQLPRAQEVRVEFVVLDPDGREVARGSTPARELAGGGDMAEFGLELAVTGARLWDIDNPQLHTLVSRVLAAGSGDQVSGTLLDELATPFGIRTVEFCPDRGFLLNGKRVKLVGSNNHQDHAGVGAAIPDALQDWRIRRLKDMGGNAYRCSHNPPTPELLEACDRLGMVVIDENRLMGTTEFMKEETRAMIRRDRNHPSVVIWSLGNEEWAIEGNEKGARIAAAMEAFARKLDPSRRFTVAISGGWGWGISTVIDVMGYNYISHGSTDNQHRDFPWQPGIGTEETTYQMTRGIYQDNKARGWMAPLENGTSGYNAVVGWKHYAARDYLAGIFYWTGFDYRGEPVPFEWPAVSSQFGIMDTCGFAKDWFWYLKSWWGREPVLHVFPHWNWPGDEGQTKKVTVHSNCARVELFLNGKSLGAKDMPANDELVWEVPYAPGVLEARGSGGVGGNLVRRVETTGPAASLYLEADRTGIKADGEDLAVVTIGARDAAGRIHPLADNLVGLALEGSGRIIGVGNGDPSSHEPDVFVEQRAVVAGTGWRDRDLDAAGLALAGKDSRAELLARPGKTGDGVWKKAFGNWTWGTPESQIPEPPAGREYRVDFDLAPLPGARVQLMVKTWADQTTVLLDGQVIASGLAKSADGFVFDLDGPLAAAGRHVLVLVCAGMGKKMDRFPDVFDPAFLCLVTPAGQWQRRLFNGLAQVIVQAGTTPGQLVLRARAEGLAPAELVIDTRAAPVRK